MYKKIVSVKGGPSFLVSEKEAPGYLSSGEFVEVKPPESSGEYRPYGNRMAEVERQVEASRKVRPQEDDSGLIGGHGPGTSQPTGSSTEEILQESHDLEEIE